MSPSAPVLLPLLLGLVLGGSTGTTPAAPDNAVPQLLQQYRDAGAHDFSAKRGAALWQGKFGNRSCTTCHGNDLREAGRHQRTGKRIAPMAPSSNPQRLTDITDIRKWLYRNCKWTLGRECTAQEKGDVLTWLRTQ